MATWKDALLGQADAIGAGGIARAAFGAQKHVPAVWSGNYSPQEKSDWLDSLKSDPTTRDSYRRFTAAAVPVLTRELPKYNAFRESLNLPPVSAQAHHAAVSQILGISSPEQDQDADATAYKTGFLRFLRDSANGPLAPDSSVDPAEFARWQADPSIRNSLNANYRVTEGGQERLDRMRDYMILRTFQTDNEHRPVFLQTAPANTIFSAVGAPFDATGMTGSSLAQGLSGKPADAMENALMWDSYYKSRMKRQPGYWNDFAGGGVLPEFSATNLTGLGKKTTDGDSWFGRSYRYMAGPFFRPGPEQMRENYNTVANNLTRFTPVTPITSDPEKERGMVEGIEKMEYDDRRIPATYLPQAINAFNDKTGANIAPFYPSGFATDVSMVPLDVALDPGNAAMTAGMLAVGLPLGGWKNAGKTIAHSLLANAQDVGPEAAYSGTLNLASQPQSIPDYLTKPTNNLPSEFMDNSGSPIDPADRKGYERALSSYEKNRAQVLQDTTNYMQNHYPQKKKSPPFGPVFGGPEAWGGRQSSVTK